MAHLVRLARDQDYVLPSNVVGELAQHSFLFLGYQLDDWDFRVLLNGLLKPIAQTGGRKLHVGDSENSECSKKIDHLVNVAQKEEAARKQEQKLKEEATKVKEEAEFQM